MMCLHKNVPEILCAALIACCFLFVLLMWLQVPVFKKMFSCESGSLGVTWVEELKARRQKLCFSALERNMNHSVFVLTCTAEDVCVAGVFSFSHGEITGEKWHSEMKVEPQVKPGFTLSAESGRKPKLSRGGNEGSCNLRTISPKISRSCLFTPRHHT